MSLRVDELDRVGLGRVNVRGDDTVNVKEIERCSDREVLSDFSADSLLLALEKYDTVTVLVPESDDEFVEKTVIVPVCVRMPERLNVTVVDLNCVAVPVVVCEWNADTVLLMLALRESLNERDVVLLVVKDWVCELERRGVGVGVSVVEKSTDSVAFERDRDFDLDVLYSVGDWEAVNVDVSVREIVVVGDCEPVGDPVRVNVTDDVG